VLGFGLGCGGCSLSYQFDSMFGKGSDSQDVTGSISPPPGVGQLSALPPENDLSYTRAAAAEVLTRGAKDASLPWENPKTGARGTVTPIATAYTLNGALCRDFLASYVNGATESWLQGEACKQQQGRWEVRQLKPWKRS
jgi:hypothetical protein